jgi:hypothetical protein
LKDPADRKMIVPTFDEASVKLFNVVDLPLEGYKTSSAHPVFCAMRLERYIKTDLSYEAYERITGHCGQYEK